jgi:alpha-methylacyl-CoA racemase
MLDGKVGLVPGVGSPPGIAYPTSFVSRLRESIRRAIASRTREEWAQAFDGTDACVTPVLTLTEALSHPHAVARSAFVTIDGLDQPAPAPRFDRTPLPVPAGRGQDDDGGIRAVLRRWQDG